MAAIDYEIRGDGSFCPMGLLVDPITELAATINVTSFKAVGVDDLSVGMAVLIDDEICRLQSITLPTLSILRGCADTIPQPHAAGTRAWFFSDAAVGDEREYLATQTVGVKLLPFTSSSGAVPVANVPPMAVTFNWRAFRPYPPGNLQVNGTPWFNGPYQLATLDPGFALTWEHRDRLLQGDQLIAHNGGSFGPETGTTYRAKIYNEANSLVRTVSDIATNTWEYTRAMRDADIPTGVGRVALCSVRGDFESLQQYSIQIAAPEEVGGGGSGFGDSFGENFGGGGSSSGGGFGDSFGENFGG